MNVIYVDDLTNSTINNKVKDISIGFFDAIHIGHQNLISKLLNSESKNDKYIITFETHPNKTLITPINEKIQLLENLGVENIIIIVMNKLNINVSLNNFNDFLVEIGVNSIYVGNDFRYAKNAEGDIYSLKSKFNVNLVEFVKINNYKVSSSTIRNLILNGEVEVIYQLLNRYYSMSGEVVKANQLGRTIGFATANILSENLTPKCGVYFGQVTVENEKYYCLTNVGFRPTLNGRNISIESHILNFNKEIYGLNIKVEFITYIREEIKFNSLYELKEQITKDKQSVIKMIQDINGE